MVIQDFDYVPHRDSSRDIEEIITEGDKQKTKVAFFIVLFLILWGLGIYFFMFVLTKDIMEGLLISIFFSLCMFLLESALEDRFDKPIIPKFLKYSRIFAGGKIDRFELTYDPGIKSDYLLKELSGYDKNGVDRRFLPDSPIEVVEDGRCLKHPILNLDEGKVYIPHDIKLLLLEEFYI